jgi:hypothetical protein
MDDYTDDDQPWQPSQMLQGLISPAPAQSLVAPPPDTPPSTQPGQTTPLTGNLANPPTQATPKIAPSSSEERAALATPHRDQSNGGPRTRVRHGLAAYFSRGIGGAVDAKYNALDAKSRLAGLLLRKANTPVDFKQSVVLKNQVQPIGATDTASGRLITQPSNNPAINQALATDAMQDYRSGLESALKHISGARLAASRSTKNPKRLANKIEKQGQPAETVSDYGAAQVSVDSLSARDAVVAAVKKNFHVLRVDDKFVHGDPQYGYRCYSMQVQMPSGASEELQIVPDEVLKVNQEQHQSYKQARDAKLAGRDADAIKSRAKAQNDAAMEKFNRRNGSLAQPVLSRGMTVLLPDGSRGRISYLDRGMQIARVKTDDGKNVTVGRRQLRVDGELRGSDRSWPNRPAKSLDVAPRRDSQ